MARHAKERARRRPHCVSAKEEYIVRKEREGRLAKGGGKEVKKEEEDTREMRMIDGEEQRSVFRKYLGESLRTERRKEIINMSTEDTEKATG
jgi:hypothetical protein